MAIKAKYLTKDGKTSGDKQIPEAIFGAPVKEHLVFDQVLAQLASRRSGNAATKTRGFVSGGGKKPYRQKGTGSARQGSIRAPNFVGGGTVFGPTPRDYTYRLPKKIRKQAMRAVLSDKQANGKVVVFGDFQMEKPQTKSVAKMLKGLEGKSYLFIDDGNDVLFKSVRNIRNAKYLNVEGVNAFDVLKYDHLLISEKALVEVEKRFGS